MASPLLASLLPPLLASLLATSKPTPLSASELGHRRGEPPQEHQQPAGRRQQGPYQPTLDQQPGGSHQSTRGAK